MWEQEGRGKEGRGKKEQEGKKGGGGWGVGDTCGLDEAAWPTVTDRLGERAEVDGRILSFTE